MVFLYEIFRYDELQETIIYILQSPKFLFAFLFCWQH